MLSNMEAKCLDVRPGVSRARADRVRWVDQLPGGGLLPERHDDEAAAVIAAELVACTLGQRHRPELRVPRLAAGGYVTRILAHV